MAARPPAATELAQPPSGRGRPAPLDLPAVAAELAQSSPTTTSSARPRLRQVFKQGPKDGLIDHRQQLALQAAGKCSFVLRCPKPSQTVIVR